MCSICGKAIDFIISHFNRKKKGKKSKIRGDFVVEIKERWSASARRITASSGCSGPERDERHRARVCISGFCPYICIHWKRTKIKHGRSVAACRALNNGETRERREARRVWRPVLSYPFPLVRNASAMRPDRERFSYSTVWKQRYISRYFFFPLYFFLLSNWSRRYIPVYYRLRFAVIDTDFRTRGIFFSPRVKKCRAFQTKPLFRFDPPNVLIATKDEGKKKAKKKEREKEIIQ